MSDARTTKVVPDVSVESPLGLSGGYAYCGARLKAAIAITVTAASGNLFMALSSRDGGWPPAKFGQVPRAPTINQLT
jgi:hypothetical protein